MLLFVPCVDGSGSFALMTKGTLLYTTKITSSKIREDMDRKKYDQYPQGRYISHIEMLHQILQVPEVITDLIFISIPTVPLKYLSVGD